MVAAWISALTGVGPSMASGNHTYSGICADLPIAPMNSRMAMIVSVPAWAIVSDGIWTMLLNMSPKFSELNVQNASRMPMVKAVSPKRGGMNAFLPAEMADCFRNQ